LVWRSVPAKETAQRRASLDDTGRREINVRQFASGRVQDLAEGHWDVNKMRPQSFVGRMGQGREQAILPGVERQYGHCQINSRIAAHDLVRVTNCKLLELRVRFGKKLDLLLHSAQLSVTRRQFCLSTVTCSRTCRNGTSRQSFATK